MVKTVSEKGDRAVSRDLARERRSGGTVARTVSARKKNTVTWPKMLVSCSSFFNSG